MMEIETDRPVYSNIKGKELTPEQKKIRNQKFAEKAKGIYSKAKESGVLSSLENLALNSKSKLPVGTEVVDLGLSPSAQTGWSTYTKTKKGLIIGGVTVAIAAIWYFAIRKK